MMKRNSNNKSNDTYGCLLCAFITTDQKKQADHWLENHSKKIIKIKEEPPQMCELCLHQFRTKEGLDHHLQNNH